jgi:hypothetical protein
VNIESSSFLLKDGRIQGGAASEGFAANSVSGGNQTVALSAVYESTATWGMGGTYTKGGVSQSGGTDIVGSNELNKSVLP